MKLQRKGPDFGKGRTQRSRGSITAYAGIITYIISLAIRIPLSGIIGDTGIGLFAPAFELFTLIALLFSYGISRTMTGLIRYRVKREQYKSAGNVFRMALQSSVLISLIFAFILATASGYLSEVLVLEAMSRKAITAVAPAAVLTALVSVFRGYFNGNGYGMLVAHSFYIEKISMLIFSLVGGRLFFEYGEKVAALQQNPMAAYAHGALGVIIGVIASELVTLIYLLFVYIIHTTTRKRQLAQDSGRRVEGNIEIAGMLFANGIPMALIVLFANLFMLIDQRFLNYCMNRTDAAAARTQLWGSYYGKFAVLTGIGAALVCLAVHGHIGKIAVAYEREEYQTMRDRIGTAVRNLCIVALPVAIYLAVLSEAFINGFYRIKDAQAVSLLRQGTVIIFFYGIAYLFGQLLLKIHMIKELLFSLLIALAVHLLLIFLLVRKGLLGINGVLYSVIAFVVVLAILTFVLAGRKLKYRQDWFYSFAFPVVSACLSGLLAMLLNKLLLGVVGNIPTILISCLVSTVLYILLLMILRVINEADLAGIPLLGSVFISIGRMIGVL